MSELELLLRFFRATSEDEVCEGVFWRTDGEYAPVTIIVVCNDLFWRACSDAESISNENIDIFEKSLKDIGEYHTRWRKHPVGRAEEPEYVGPDLGLLLFCCRARKMRPQGCYYKEIPRSVWHLFDACGPERVTDASDPHNTSKPT